MAKETGRVLAFDIQEAALCATDRLLKEQGCGTGQSCIWTATFIWTDICLRNLQTGSILILAICREEIIVWLPEDTSVKAIDAGLSLKKKGVMALCIYSGGDTGFEEKI